ncbi:MAG: penicillin-binding protein 2 [Acidobacteria bacterium]|nr:penicillin-binding protein 2 [Acidobacteriota bacterium]MBV9476229.1 penicillin-binding protein 2 [Acidobacteriota bacterium]
MRVYRDDQKFLQFRINAVMWGIVAAFVFLAGSFWFVQGVQAEKYRGLSEANAMRQIQIPAKRGLIMDRHGKILADNQPAYSLEIDRVVMKPLAKADPARKAKLVAFLSTVLGTPVPELTARYDKEAKEVPFTRPFPIAEDLTMSQVASLQAESIAFPEINVVPVQRRNYPYATMAAHVLGFIGEVGEKELKQNNELAQGDLIGKRGVELMYDQYLRGRGGAEYWEYDADGRRLSEYIPARKQPVPGDNIYLTLDFELQRRAEQYFAENEMVGAAVALDPKSGEVLAMVSSPAFNPNVYSKRFSPDVWKTITSNPFKIELNRAIQGLYSPGSVFKIVMGMAGLSEGVVSPGTEFGCGGSAVFFGRRFRCYKREGHGTVNLARAIKVSCDIYFYNVGARLGVDKIAEYAHKLSFGEISHIDLDGERPGIVPSTAWATNKQHRKWYPSETISVAIGQGPLIVTPLQVANMLAAVANGGKVFQPHVVRYVDRVQPNGEYKRFRVPSRVIHEVTLAPNALQSVREGLWKVVNEEGGTGGNARIDGLDISGKTGTVQVIAQHGWVKTEGLPFRYKDHAWFASFAPLNNPQMVVVVFIEHGGHGGTDAAPLAKLLYEARFRDQVTGARLDLSNPQTLEQIKEGELPLPTTR